MADTDTLDPSAITPDVDLSTGTADSTGDTPPKRRAPRPSARTAKARTTREIEAALTEILALPAIPFAIAGDEFCANHFTTASADFANKIAAQSERNETLRKWCERLLEGESLAVLLFAGMTYALPPLIHHNVIPGADGMRAVFSVPEHNTESNSSNSSNSNGNTHD